MSKKAEDNFITNSPTKHLKERILELISESRELKFLVGFFYFSGLKELYEGLLNNSETILKVLVGLDVDRTIYGLIEYGREEKASDEEKIFQFFESIKKSINTEHFDNREFYEQARFFLKMIEKKLIIRKTFEPNHSKLYIFKLAESQVGRRNLFITGSSNLTYSGLTKQREFNVEISDYGFEEAERYFDELWGRGIRITEYPDVKKRLIDLIKEKTLIKELTPFEAFVLVLKTYLESSDRKEVSENLGSLMEKAGYYSYQYQMDAIKQSLTVIEQYSGLIVADVVGLGKTIIACLVAKLLKKRGIVICPPGIMGDRNKEWGWTKYLEDFGLHNFGWEVRSLGELADEEEKLAEYVARNKDIEVIIVDEAHRFRNEDTKSHEQLKNICRNKTVILLTATPFNNRPGDILSLLKLFITPKKSFITLDNNLVDKFRNFKGTFDKLGFIKKYYNSSNKDKREKAENIYRALFGKNHIELKEVNRRAKYLARQIRDVIEPVTIRRNRLDLQKNPHYKNEVKNLTKTADPIEWFFELEKEQSDFYDAVIGECFADPDDGGLFKGAIYHPFEYERSREIEKLNLEDNRQFMQQKNLYDFMRRLLVKRFESSFGSFEQSLENFKKVTGICKDFIDKTDKFILDRNLVEDIYNKEPEEIEKHLSEYGEKIKEGVYPKNHKIYDLKKFEFKNEFIRDIKSDLKLFEDILKKLSALNLVDRDPKVICLLKHLKEELAKPPLTGEPQRKIVVFSEYADTVKYLEPILGKSFSNRLLTIHGTLTKKNINDLNTNFDASFKKSEDEYDILLTTDKLSEGVNLNRAGMVVNYDIPWNPVRVIQRLGRINRIGKKVFNEIYIVNFFPTEKGAELVKSREIAANKMFLIHHTLGEDSKIFDIEEEPTPSGLYDKIRQNPDLAEEESFYVRTLNEYEKLKKQYPEIIKKLDNCPPRVKVAKRYKEDELLVFIKKGRLYVRCVNYGDNKVRDVVMEDVLEKIRCSKDEKSLNWNTDRFWGAYEMVKEFKEKAAPLSDQSLEQKALNNLKTFIDKIQVEEIMPHKDFLRILREDILDYGTLPDYTLRRLANLEASDERKIKKAADEISMIRNRLGDNYLLKEKDKKEKLDKEIIIAIENQSEINA